MDPADGWWSHPPEEAPSFSPVGEPEIKNGHFYSCYICGMSFHQVPEEAIVRNIYEATEETKDAYGWRQTTVLYKYVISWCRGCNSVARAK